MPTILVVSDKPDIRQKLCLIYLQGGYVVLEAKDNELAFALARENPFDVIFIALKSTEDALQTCSRFVHEFNAPVLLLTTIEHIDAVLNVGADDIVMTLHPRLLLYRTSLVLKARESVSQRQLAEALRDTAAILNSTLEVDTVLDRILTLIQDVIPNDLSTIYLIDHQTNQAKTVRTLSTKHPELINEMTQVILPVNDISHLRWMINTKESLLIHDTLAIHSWVSYPPIQWVRSVLSVPLQVNDQVIGFIFLNAAVPNAFTDVETKTLEIFANQASIAVGNANLYQARIHHADEMKRQVAARTAELEQKSSQLQAILESIGEGVQGILFDEHMQNPSYSFINPALFHLFGYRNEELPSIDTLRPDDVSAIEFQATTAEIFRDVFQHGIWKGERRLKRKDGTVVDTGLVVTGLTSNEGRVIGVVSIFRDLSQQKALDAQKERFVGHAAHELRNPIAAFKLRLHLLALQPERLQTNVAILDRIIGHMENLVEDMLDLTRFENGLIRLKDDVTEITSFIRETILIMESEAEAKNVWLIDRLTQEPIYVSIDPTRMTQVIMNLVSNAVKYTPEDNSVTLSVEKGAVGSATEGYMIMKIIDTGDGIAPQYLPFIFEPFYQVRTGGRGLGLGLAIIKEIVDLHGGHISVESELGKGTTFTVLLKLVNPPA